MKISEMREKQAKLVADARALREEINDTTTEARIAEIDASHDAAMAEYDRLEARIAREEALEIRAAALDAADERRPVGEDRAVKPGKKDERTEDEKRAAIFDKFVRHGFGELDRDERAFLKQFEERAQSVGTNTAGGYFVPDQFQAELVKSMKMWGPMLDPGVNRMLTTATGATLTWPTMDDTANVGALIAENQQVSLSEASFGTRSLDAYKYTSGVVLISNELLQDAVMSVDSIISDAMSERIGRISNTHLTTGDGANKPRGIVTAAGAGITSSAATALTFDDLIELEHSVDPAYRSDPSVRWMFNDTTLKALRKIKDGDGNYIWQPANSLTGAPQRIFEYGYVVNQAVANIGSGAKSVLFGAMNKYVVRMVKQFALKRLVERYADYDQVGFIGFQRIDGDLMDTGAVKVLLHP